MSDPITLPTPGEIAERIRACREELAALRRLDRMARAAQAAREARERRGPGPIQKLTPREQVNDPTRAAPT